MIQDAFGLIFTGEANPYMRDLTLSRAVARCRSADAIASIPGSATWA